MTGEAGRGTAGGQSGEGVRRWRVAQLWLDAMYIYARTHPGMSLAEILFRVLFRREGRRGLVGSGA